MNKETLALLQRLRADFENMLIDFVEAPSLCDWKSIAKKRIDEINTVIEDSLK